MRGSPLEGACPSHHSPAPSTNRGAKMHIAADAFSAAPAVRSMTNEDGGVLMNVDSGLVYSLNIVGAHIWRKIEAHHQGLTMIELFESVRADFDGVEEERLRADLEVFVAGLAKTGLVREWRHQGDGHTKGSGSDSSRGRGVALGDRASTETALSGPGPGSAVDIGFDDRVESGSDESVRPRRFETLIAFMGLAAVDLVLKLGGFRSLYWAVKRWPVSRRGIAAPGTIARVRHAVDRACVFYLGSALCLQRSAVTTCLLRARAVPAQMVIACRKMPFRGHAWVEVNGRVVNDTRIVRESYSVLDRC